VDPHCREDYACQNCDKIRAICRDCNNCQECCQCNYCDLCGLPNGYNNRSECTCFQCEACHQTFTEDDQVLDDGNYANEYIDARRPYQYVCLKCYEKRKEAWKKAGGT
jgi:hypothetical protein